MGKEKGKWFRSRRLWYCIGGIFLLGLLVFIFRAQLLSSYARWFSKDNAERGADAIVILSGGKLTRLPHALKLWTEDFAPSLYVTDQKSVAAEFQDMVISNLEFAARLAAKRESNATFALIPSLTGGATSTFDEAYDTLSYAQSKNWKRIIIVTDAFHTRRALHAYEKVFEGSEIEVQVSAAGNDVFDESNWWKTDRGISSYVLETIKYPVYLFWSEEPKLVENH